MKQKIRSKGLTAGSLFKVIWIGFLFSIGPIMLMVGIMSLLGHNVIFFEGKPVIGVEGLLSSLVLLPVFATFFTVTLWVMLSIGCWIYSRFASMELTYKSVETSAQTK